MFIHNGVSTRSIRVVRSAQGPAPVDDVTLYDWLEESRMICRGLWLARFAEMGCGVFPEKTRLNFAKKSVFTRDFQRP